MPVRFRSFLLVILGSLLLASAVLLSAQPKATTRMSDAMVTLAPHLTARTCMLQITPPMGTEALVPGHDQVDACPNEFGVDWTIRTVSCYANHGTPTVTLKLTGGNATSIVDKPIPCGERTWMSGPVNGAPLLHSFSGLGSTCAQAPCSLDASVVAVTGVSQWVILRITGQL